MEWLPIETAPRDGTKILVCTKEGRIDISWWIRDGFCAGGDVYDSYIWTTFGRSALANWMPLPPPPKATE